MHVCRFNVMPAVASRTTAGSNARHSSGRYWIASSRSSASLSSPMRHRTRSASVGRLPQISAGAGGGEEVGVGFDGDTRGAGARAGADGIGSGAGGGAGAGSGAGAGVGDDAQERTVGGSGDSVVGQSTVFRHSRACCPSSPHVPHSPHDHTSCEHVSSTVLPVPVGAPPPPPPPPAADATKGTATASAAAATITMTNGI